MKDYSDMFPVEPIIGWGTTNYRDRSKNGEVQQYQGFKGCTLTGERLPSTSYERDMIAVPEGRFHTSEDFFHPTPERAVKEAIDHVRRINAEATRILESVRQIQKGFEGFPYREPWAEDIANHLEAIAADIRQATKDYKKTKAKEAKNAGHEGS